MWRSVSAACCGAAAPLIVTGVVVLAVAMGIRYGLIESDVYSVGCVSSQREGALALCGIRDLIVQAFLQQRLGWLSLACALAAVVLRSRALAWIGWLSGLSGLVLYNFDLAAAGGLLSLLILARAPAQGGRGEAQCDG